MGSIPITRSDDEIATIARRDLNKMMTFHGDPEFTIVNRLTKSMPQYHIGHIGQIRKFNNTLKIIILHSELQVHHLKLVGLPDCIQQGKNAVEELLDEI